MPARLFQPDELEISHWISSYGRVIRVVVASEKAERFERKYSVIPQALEAYLKEIFFFEKIHTGRSGPGAALRTQ